MNRQTQNGLVLPPSSILLGVDTCGPTGSVALARISPQGVQLVGEIELEGRTYSATLVSAVRSLLQQAGVGIGRVACIVAVNGPGSFTGVRVGLSAVKGLAEAKGTPVLAVSRLEVLASKAGVTCAALDAHRHEVFLRIQDPPGDGRELVAAAGDLVQLPAPSQVAVCEEPSRTLLAGVWPESMLVTVEAPTAADALTVAVSPGHAGPVDLALLDGHYLRRSDVEIFGPPARSG